MEVLRSNGHKKTNEIVLLALFFAMAMVLSVVESALPPLPIAVPGVKFGLSNIVVMYVLFFMGWKQAYTVAVLKAFLVAATRGLIAGGLSLSGGLLSLTIMLVLLAVFKEKISYLLLSIFGAIFHNVGQLGAICLIYTNIYLMFYLPVLLIFGVIAGIVTSVLLKFIMPAFIRVGFNNN